MKKITVFVLLFLFFLPLSGFAAYDPPVSDILLFVDEEGGLRGPLSNLSRVPVFCLYKDGRLIYSQTDASGFVSLMETTLKDDKISEITSMFAASDEWNDAYENCPIKDMPLLRITSNLKGEPRKFSIRGVDYAVKNKTIPQELAKIYRYVAYFSDPDSKDYESPDIFFYVKSAADPKGSKNSSVFKWRARVELAPIVNDTTFSGFATVRLSGKQAKSVIRELSGKTPYNSSELPVFFKQGNSFYTLGFRPLLPHELK